MPAAAPSDAAPPGRQQKKKAVPSIVPGLESFVPFATQVENVSRLAKRAMSILPAHRIADVMLQHLDFEANSSGPVPSGCPKWMLEVLKAARVQLDAKKAQQLHSVSEVGLCVGSLRDGIQRRYAAFVDPVSPAGFCTDLVPKKNEKCSAKHAFKCAGIPRAGPPSEPLLTRADLGEYLAHVSEQCLELLPPGAAECSFFLPRVPLSTAASLLSQHMSEDDALVLLSSAFWARGPALERWTLLVAFGTSILAGDASSVPATAAVLDLEDIFFQEAASHLQPSVFLPAGVGLDASDRFDGSSLYISDVPPQLHREPFSRALQRPSDDLVGHKLGPAQIPWLDGSCRFHQDEFDRTQRLYHCAVGDCVFYHRALAFTLSRLDRTHAVFGPIDDEFADSGVDLPSEFSSLSSVWRRRLYDIPGVADAVDHGARPGWLLLASGTALQLHKGGGMPAPKPPKNSSR
jgi:hypothetical protein